MPFLLSIPDITEISLQHDKERIVNNITSNIRSGKMLVSTVSGAGARTLYGIIVYAIQRTRAPGVRDGAVSIFSSVSYGDENLG